MSRRIRRLGTAHRSGEGFVEGGTISFGVPAGATGRSGGEFVAGQTGRGDGGTPGSEPTGTEGVTPIARKVPALMNSRVTATSVMTNSMRPPSRSVIARACPDTNLDSVDAGHRLHQLRCRQASGVACTVAQLAWVCLGVSDELTKVLGRKRRTDDEHQRIARQPRDWREVGNRIERQLVVEMDIRRVRRVGGEVERIAVGLCRAASAAPRCRWPRPCSRRRLFARALRRLCRQGIAPRYRSRCRPGTERSA